MKKISRISWRSIRTLFFIQLACAITCVLALPFITVKCIYLRTTDLAELHYRKIYLPFCEKAIFRQLVAIKPSAIFAALTERGYVSDPESCPSYFVLSSYRYTDARTSIAFYKSKVSGSHSIEKWLVWIKESDKALEAWDDFISSLQCGASDDDFDAAVRKLLVVRDSEE